MKIFVIKRIEKKTWLISKILIKIVLIAFKIYLSTSISPNIILCFRRRSYPARIENENKGIRFAVRSLGWVEICEDDLTPERSSKAVNKCIVDLSLGRNDFIDNVGRWGDVSANTEIPLLNCYINVILFK